MTHHIYWKEAKIPNIFHQYFVVYTLQDYNGPVNSDQY